MSTGQPDNPNRPARSGWLGFGTLRLDCGRRQLFDGELPLRLGGRAMDLLIALVERAPGVVSKAELEARVWPRSVVEESSLRVQVGALRKVLGDGVGGARYIANVPGRGYAFVAPLQALPAAQAAPRPAAPAARVHLPARLTTMFGRERSLQVVAGLLASHRLVSIVGAGGVGKTTLAIAVAEVVAAGTGCGVSLADLSALTEAERVPAAVALALGVAWPPGAGEAAIAAQLQDRQELLVLDNCEHVLETAAALAQQLLQAVPGLRILATSHEALMVGGERSHRLEPLATPPAGLVLDAAGALQYPAVALLADRAAADAADFELGDAEAPLAAELCRRLDGLPLAIEMAAARIAIFGLRDLVARLDERLGFLSGDRTTRNRHRTLQALHEWSYAQLPEAGQALLRRLSVFAGPFTLAAASRIAPGDGLLDGVVDLVGRSLLLPDFNGDTARYRLLMTTRHFAREKLARSAEHAAVRTLHLAWLSEALAAANAEWLGSNRGPWTEAHAPLFDEVLHALDWAMSPEGSIVPCAELTLVAMHLSHQLSAHERYQRYLTEVLGRFTAVADAHPLLELRLCVALGVARALSGAPQPEIEPIYRRGVEAAGRLGPGLHEAETPYGMFLGALIGGDYPRALALARQIEAASLAHGDAGGGLLVARRMLAQALHHLGEHEAARGLALQVLREDRRFVRLGGYWIDPVDRQVSLRIVLARVLWLQGRPERALATVREALALGALDICTAQVQVIGSAAIPLACWTGDLAWARELTDELMALASRHGLGFWVRWAHAIGQLLAGQPVPRPAGHWLADLLCTLSPLAVDTEAVARVEAGTVGWCGPEVLRCWGERLLAAGEAEDGRRYLERALALARRQGALGWELRAAMSLARLQPADGPTRDSAREALALLDEVLARFDEGRATADLQAAVALREALSPARGPAGRGPHAGRPSRNLR